MAGVLSSKRNSVRFKVLRRSSVETTAGTLATLPLGFAELDSSLLIMAWECVPVRVDTGEIERRLVAGEMRKL
jgi:hypothetical protein